MLRVIAGSARGRRIKTLPGRTTRPTADRVKEALFNILGGSVAGARVLDLFAGTGSLGIEALSRGAASAVFIDADPRCRRLIYDNLMAVGLAGRGRVRGGRLPDALAVLAAEGYSFDLVFLDPPYGRGLLPPVLAALGQAGVLAAGARVVAEHHRDDAVGPVPPGWELRDSRRYGDTLLSFFVVGGRKERGAAEENEVVIDTAAPPAAGG